MPQNMQELPFEIVIAEDNSADVMLVQQPLKAHKIDCTVHVLRDGEQALTFLEKADNEPGLRRMDLLLLDLHLPKCAGEEVLKKLRATARNADAPVIIMTSMHAEAPELQRAAEIASVCFPKPSTLDGFLNLGAIVRRLLEEKSVETRAMKSGRDPEGMA
jgi:CheY-like chemotaxis protein